LAKNKIGNQQQANYKCTPCSGVASAYY